MNLLDVSSIALKNYYQFFINMNMNGTQYKTSPFIKLNTTGIDIFLLKMSYTGMENRSTAIQEF